MNTIVYRGPIHTCLKPIIQEVEDAHCLDADPMMLYADQTYQNLRCWLRISHSATVPSSDKWEGTQRQVFVVFGTAGQSTATALASLSSTIRPPSFGILAFAADNKVATLEQWCYLLRWLLHTIPSIPENLVQQSLLSEGEKDDEIARICGLPGREKVIRELAALRLLSQVDPAAASTLPLQTYTAKCVLAAHSHGKDLNALATAELDRLVHPVVR